MEIASFVTCTISNIPFHHISPINGIIFFGVFNISDLKESLLYVFVITFCTSLGGQAGTWTGSLVRKEWRDIHLKQQNTNKIHGLKIMQLGVQLGHQDNDTNCSLGDWRQAR